MIEIEQKRVHAEAGFSGGKDSYAPIKRVIDLVASIVLLILLSPLLLVISVLLFVHDGTPVIFRQTRLGEGGRPFTILKFRTMPVLKTEKKQPDREGWANGVPDDFVFKSEQPSGISPLCKMLRKYSLDELPQLINVIAGNMSLIGPRPEVPVIARYYNEEQLRRLAIKPGMTGYAQVKGRSHLNHGEKIICDLYYVENCSLRLDFGITLATILQVIKARDNY